MFDGPTAFAALDDHVKERVSLVTKYAKNLHISRTRDSLIPGPQSSLLQGLKQAIDRISDSGMCIVYHQEDTMRHRGWVYSWSRSEKAVETRDLISRFQKDYDIKSGQEYSKPQPCPALAVCSIKSECP